jgi:hypothetical protein
MKISLFSIVSATLFGSLFLLSIASGATAPPPSHDGWGVINCTCGPNDACRFHSLGEPQADHNEVTHSNVMKWMLSGSTGTIVKIKFAPGKECSVGVSPFNGPDPEKPIKNSGHIVDVLTSPPVKDTAEGCYNYIAWCTGDPEPTQSQSQSGTSGGDPIIDVPPGH